MISTSSVSPKPVMRRVETTRWLATTKPRVTVANEPRLRQHHIGDGEGADGEQEGHGSLHVVGQKEPRHDEDQESCGDEAHRDAKSHSSEHLECGMNPTSVRGQHEVQHDHAEDGADRIENGSLPVQHRTRWIAWPNHVQQRSDDRGAGDDDDGAGHERELGGNVERDRRRGRSPGERDRQPDGHQSHDRAAALGGEVAEPQLNAALEQQQAHQQRHERVERVPEELVGLHPAEDVPAKRPAGSRISSDGTPVRRPIHCAPTPNTMIVASPMKISFSLMISVSSDLAAPSSRFDPGTAR